MPSVFRLSLVFLILILSSCGSDGPVDQQPVNGAAANISAASGGTVSVGSGPIAGSSVTIPAGSIPAEVRIFVQPASEPAFTGQVSPVVEFGPAGTQFEPPATVTLPFETNEDPATLVIGKLVGSALIPLDNIVVNTSNGTVSGSTDSFSLFVVVLPSSPRLPQPPVADAGVSRSVDPGTAVQLDGSNSTDPNGDALTYRWTLVESPATSSAALDADTGVEVSFTPDTAGDYVIELVVDDGSFQSEPDRLVITTRNAAPTADAGPDQSVAAGAAVTLDGSGSTDPNGDALTYFWSFEQVPDGSTASLVSPESVMPAFSVDLPGTYAVALTVSDGSLSSPADTVRISTLNTAPVANAGPDQTVPLLTMVELDAAGSTDVDGNSLTFTWSILEAPSGSSATLSDPAAVMPTFQLDAPGAFIIQLAVDDGTATSFDTVRINSENSAPVAIAGDDQTAAINSVVTLDGSRSSDPDGTPLNFQWAIGSMPEGSSATLSDADSVSPTLITDVAGVYTISLVVSDGFVESAPDTVVVRVGASNTPPIAVPGQDQQLSVGETATIDGTGSRDADGDALTYQWSVISSPAGAGTLSDPASALTTLSTDMAGDYVVQLIVGDGVANSSPATVTLRFTDANQAPEIRASFESLVVPNTLVTLDASESSDPEDQPLSFSWSLDRLPEGSGTTLSGKNTASPTLTPDIAGIYRATLSLSDGETTTSRSFVIDVVDRSLTDIRGAFERCSDGVDNDGDGSFDNDDPMCAPGCDVDSDGSPGAQCGGADANDFDAGVFPGASELCDDFTDNNQNGRIDEGCLLSGVELGPADLSMIAGDSADLAIVSSDPSYETDWRLAVDGIENGDDVRGRLFQTEAQRLLYVAPTVDDRTDFTLSVTDPDDASVTASANVTVLPPGGNIEIVGGPLTLSLEQAHPFTAVMRIAGETVRLRRPVWFVNGIAGGNQQVGRIDSQGLYRAPASMPQPLPFPVIIGVAPGATQGPAATTPVLLRALEPSPKRLTVRDTGNAGAITATLVYSDGTTEQIAPQELRFFSLNTDVAAVDASGNITVLEPPGRTALQTVHAPTGAAGVTSLVSVSRSVLTNSVTMITDDRAAIMRDDNGSVSEMEVTNSRAQFYFEPQLVDVRGPGKDIQRTTTGDSLTLSGEDGAIVYGDADGLPDRNTFTVAVNRDSLIATIGNLPGNARVTALWSEGDRELTATTTIIYSRPELAISWVGNETGETGAVYQTEFTRFRVTASNPREGSSFLDNIRLQIGTESNERFVAGFARDVESGIGEVGPKFADFRSSRTHEITIPGSHLDSDSGSTIEFLGVPPGTGDQKFLFDLASDRNAPSDVIVVPTRQVNLGMAGCGIVPAGITLGASRNGVAPGPIVKGSWAQVFHAGPDTPPRSSVLQLVHEPGVYAFATNDTATWRVTGPNTEFDVPAKTVGWLPFNARNSGTYTVSLSLESDPTIKSELVLNVVEPSSVGSVPQPQIVMNSEGESVPPEGRLGAVEIVSATELSTWQPDELLTIVLRTYDATGTARTIGREIETRGFNAFGTQNSIERVTELIVPDPRPRSGGSISVESREFKGVGEIEYKIRINNSVSTQDLVINFEPRRVIPNLFNRFDEDLDVPREIREERNGVTTVVESAPPVGVTEFIDATNATYIEPCLFYAGFEAFVSPRELPVASDRLRQVVVQTPGSELSDKLRFTIQGASGFSNAAVSGISNIDLGEGVNVVSSSVEAGVVNVVASTATNIGRDGGPPLGTRSFSATFADGSTWKGNYELYRTEIQTPEDMPTRHLPLNGRHEGLPPGAQVFFAGAPGNPFESSATALEIKLIPSTAAGGEFRGRTDVPAPTVSLARDKEDGQLNQLEKTILTANSTGVLVYGDRRDDYTLRDGMLTKALPDGYPDLVSPSLDAEMMTAGTGGNLADAVLFSVFNVETRVDDETTPNQITDLTFEPLAESIDKTYNKYLLPSERGITGRETPRERVHVHVDSEAAGISFLDDGRTPGNPLDDVISDRLPFAFFAGMLDQYYQEKYFQGRFEKLGRDGRVHGLMRYEGESVVADDPSFDRDVFGVALDGVLYDVTVAGVDEDPNSSALLALPVVESLSAGEVTALGFVRDVGGRSGGFADRGEEQASLHMITAATPGADVPGLHAAYLVDGRIEDQLSMFGGTENDVGDIRLRRDLTPGQLDVYDAQRRIRLVPPEGGLNIDTRVAGSFPRVARAAHTFATDDDKKAPIRTALSMTTGYKVVTDPEGLPNAKFKTSLLVAERPFEHPIDSYALSLTTQSIGDEARAKKVLLDAISDLTIDVLYTGLATVLTGPGYLEACGSGLLENVTGKLQNAAFGLARIDIERSSKPAAVLLDKFNSLQNDGWEPFYLGDTGIQFTLGDIAEPKLFADGKLLKTEFPTLLGAFDTGLCALVDAPKEQFKAFVRDQFSEEDLGGNGSARARVLKSVTVGLPPEAIEGPGVGVHTFSITRDISLEPEEFIAVDLASRPDLAAYDTGISVESDRALIARALADLDSQTSAGAAEDFLKRLAVNSVIRNTKTEAGASVMRRYRLRAMKVPQLMGFIGSDEPMTPGGTAEFTLETNVSKLPVSASSLVAVSRSNFNATAQATIKVPGYDVIPVIVFFERIAE